MIYILVHHNKFIIYRTWSMWLIELSDYLIAINLIVWLI